VVREKLSNYSLFEDIFYDCWEGMERNIVRSTGPGYSLAQTMDLLPKLVYHYMEKLWTADKIQLYNRIPIVPIDSYLKERRRRYIENARHKNFIQENLPDHIEDRIKRHIITYKELLSYLI